MINSVVASLQVHTKAIATDINTCTYTYTYAYTYTYTSLPLTPHHRAMDDILATDPRTTDVHRLDPRITYNAREDRYLLDLDSDTYEYNTVLSKWLPTSYAEESNMTEAQLEILAKRQKKLQELKEKEVKEKKNTAVYVSGLPLDCDALELKLVFGKYGVIAEDLLTGKPKIKLYQDDNGLFKGDALVIYMKPESVELAVQMLDDTSLRVGGGTIKVSRAEFKQSTNTENSIKRSLTQEDKRIIKKKIKQMNDKVQDWHGDDDSVNPKWIRTMVLRRVFTLEEIEDEEEKEDIIEDIKEGCQQYGTIDKVILFDQEEDGVVLVRFDEPSMTTRAIEAMDGRFFAGRKLIATVYNGESFQKGGNSISKDQAHTHDDADDDNNRLEEYIAQNTER